jgi:hypothetical protein
MVPRGTFPRTIAEGDREAMTLYRPLGLIDVERYQKIDIHARAPDEVYPSPEALDVERNCDFLRQCLRRIPRVDFVDETTGTAYARCVSGRIELLDGKVFEHVARDEETARLFHAIAPALQARAG